ncbi:hypothetical protein MA16_Dca011533 [Dendrobium catenatum]|uniref:Uncharacterized protein n=1 Tax=Dendrobium catenatum TaxID=906689 RepID=A0A2I0W612_9ASPA|nr:hypothetical protein MA16_Dca011533 [Dendrobium catenatum]
MGHMFTWSNNKKGLDRIIERFDRMIFYSYSINTNQRLVVKHLPRIASDHCPILLNLSSLSPKLSNSIKFENIWASYPASYSVVNNVWNRRLLSNAILERENIGVRVSGNSPRITLLLYADDVIVFAEAKITNVKLIKEIINKYCNWTGQKVNTSKSGLLFGKVVNTKMKSKIKNILGYKEVKEFCYLSTRLALRKLSRSDYQFIVDNVMKRLNSWGSKFLSLAVKITLVKSVILSIPSFHTTVSLIPK